MSSVKNQQQGGGGNNQRQEALRRNNNNNSSCRSSSSMTKTKTKDLWTEIFPAQVNTRPHSVVMIKKLMAVAISNVLYLRALLPESAFSERRIDSLELPDDDEKNKRSKGKKKAFTRLKILKDDTPASSQIIKWLKGSFEALDKNYLRKLEFSICSDISGKRCALETYCFDVEYAQSSSRGGFQEDLQSCAPSAALTIGSTFHPKQQNASSLHTMTFDSQSAASQATVPTCSNNTSTTRTAVVETQRSLRRCTTRLLRTLIVLTQSLDDLPQPESPQQCAELFLTMRLFYRDQLVPLEFEPSGFRNCKTLLEYPFKTATIKAGEVDTVFHNFQCRVKTNKSSFESEENLELEETENATNNSLGRNQGVISANHKDFEEEKRINEIKNRIK
ncbi:MAG: HORMA domain-containing protein 1, partial [Marteilia pararefringens]